VNLVRVWTVSGDAVPAAALAELYSTLDADERRRAERFGQADDRRRFIVAHGIVRSVVADQLGAPAREIRWEIGPNGKPELAGDWTGVHANLSHSGRLILVATSTSRRVGADIQRLVPHLGVRAMANRYFRPEEARLVLAGVGAHDRFARVWSRKEAVAKADGSRLTQILPLSVLGDVVVDDRSGESYRVADVPAPPGFRAAVALCGGDAFEVMRRRWRWSDVLESVPQ
jgi:4'-phosphopantetheinyl transferase